MTAHRSSAKEVHVSAILIKNEMLAKLQSANIVPNSTAPGQAVLYLCICVYLCNFAFVLVPPQWAMWSSLNSVCVCALLAEGVNFLLSDSAATVHCAVYSITSGAK